MLSRGAVKGPQLKKNFLKDALEGLGVGKITEGCLAQIIYVLHSEFGLKKIPKYIMGRKLN